MEFTYGAYRNMLNKLKNKGYSFANYETCDNYDRCVILRHDIDYSLDKSVEMAKVEAEEGVFSTYFVLVTSEFYNMLARENIEKVLTIHQKGHQIGLHFDEENYDYNSDINVVEKRIINEVDLLSRMLGIKISTVSMHRPSKQTLDADYKFENIINSYGEKFFKKFKYVSDSRHRWRENVNEIIESGKYDKLHILTHAFWYSEENENIETTVGKFVFNGNVDRYKILERNITDLQTILKREKL